jgi:hypothetical protein
MAMSWSYVDPTKNAKDAVRLLIGDTNSKDPLLYDNEIQYFLAQYSGSVLQTAIRCLESVMTKFSRMADESVGSVKINYSQRAKGAMVAMDQMRRRLAIDGDLSAYAGGLSQADKQATTANTDRVKPDFSKHMMENDLITPRTTSENGPYDNGDEDNG